MNRYTARRHQIINQMENQALSVIASGVPKVRNGDVHHRFRASSSFLYLTGSNIQNAYLLLSSHKNHPTSVLFVEDPNPIKVKWEGGGIDVIQLEKDTGVEKVLYHSEMQAYLKKLSSSHKTCYAILSELADSLSSYLQTNLALPQTSPFLDLAPLIASIRLYKDTFEINAIKKAIEYSCLAHEAVMSRAKPGLYEYQLEASFLSCLHNKGYRDVAYPCIVAAGGNACILHYNDHGSQLMKGDLLLVDAGAEVDGYAADITRTYPVGTTFSPLQKMIYEAVLDVQEQVIAMVKPGVDFGQLNRSATSGLTQALIDFGLIKGPLDQALDNESFKPFYFHSVGHWLGLDVHDVGAYRQGDQPIVFEPGMVLTVEPGLYFSSDIEGLSESWHNIGVRIEDDILVTETGCEVLSQKCPKSVDALLEMKK